MNLPELKNRVGMDAVDAGTGKTVTVLRYERPAAGKSAIQVEVQVKGEKPYWMSATWLR